MKTKDYIALALLGAGAYMVYKFWGTLKKATIPISDAISNAYLDVTLPAPVTVTGSIALPDGSFVALTGPSGTLQVDSNYQVTINGHRYQLSQHDANGNYPATLLY